MFRVSKKIKESAIDLSDISSKKSIYELVKNLEVVEIKSDFMFRDVFEILVDDKGSVYIKDFISAMSGGIVKIDSLGNEIFSITAKGGGPEEFQCIDVFTIHNSTLIYFDCLKRRFVYHDIGTGRFIKEIPYMDSFINQIAMLNDNDMMVIEINLQEESKVSVISSTDFTRKKTILKDRAYFLSFFGTTLVKSDAAHIVYKSSLKDTIHIIKNDEVVESIYLNFGNNPLTMEKLANGKMSYEERIELYQSSDIQKVTLKVLAFTNHIAFKSQVGEKEYFNLINLNTKTCDRFRLDVEEFPFPLFVKNDVFYSIIAGENLQMLITKKVFNDLQDYSNMEMEGKTFILKFQMKQ